MALPAPLAENGKYPMLRHLPLLVLALRLPADAQSLLAEAKALRAGLITTGKDIARLKGASGALAELSGSALALPITIEFLGDGEASLMKAIAGAFDLLERNA